MAATSQSFAEILNNRHRGDSHTGSWQPVPFSPQPQRPVGGGFRRTGQDRPSSSHSPVYPSSASVHDGTRNSASPSITSQRSSTLTSFTKHPERRISDLSVVTQVRVPTPSSQDTAIRSSRQHSGRTTPRPSSPVTSHKSSQKGLELQTHPSQETIADAGVASRRTLKEDFEGQNPSARAKEKLTNMFGAQVIEDGASALANKSSPAYNTTPSSPAVPMKSPLRLNSPAKLTAPYRRHARNSNSIDRTTHNNSVASSAHLTESEHAAANSDVFSQDGETEGAYESDISSLGDDEASEAEPDNRRLKTRSGGTVKNISTRRTLRNDSLYSQIDASHSEIVDAPSTAAIHDVLATQHGPDLFPQSAPAFSPTSSTRSSKNDPHASDLSRRPPSPELSDISDAESFDSAVPPPVSLTRDTTGPRYRNRAEQKLGPASPRFGMSSPSHLHNKSSPNLALAKSTSWTAAGKTSFAASADARTVRSRMGSSTPTRSRAASRADSLPTLGFTNTRTTRSASVAVEQPTTHTKTFNISLPSISNIFGGFSFKSKTKKAPPPPLPPLRKITFDSRGQKQIMDLNTPLRSAFDANEVGDLALPDDDNDISPSQLQSEMPKISVDGERSASSQSNGQTAGACGSASQSGWRTREKGAPRRTAWR